MDILDELRWICDQTRIETVFCTLCGTCFYVKEALPKCWVNDYVFNVIESTRYEC